ncbi:MAG TPA: PGPGW domain-containing protein [Actinomycetota bacterium]|nr:PGPGW domain-containing protein [Actinomycetota bacterium]
MGIDDTTQLPGDSTAELPKTIAIRHTRRVVIGVIGTALVGVGIALLALPGPGLLVILAGLTVLSWEFRWAKRMLVRFKTKIKELKARRTAR